MKKTLFGLLNISATSLPSSQVTALATSLSVQAADSDELSPAAGNLVVNCAQTLLSEMTKSNIDYQVASSTIVQAVDSAVSTGGVSPHVFITALKTFGSLVTNQLYAGQSSVGSINSNFRLINSAVFSSAQIMLPQSDLESIAGKKANGIDVTNLLSDEPAHKVSIIEPQLMLFNQSNLFKSNPLIVTISHQSITSSTRFITVNLVNLFPQSFPNNTANITTLCKRNTRPLIRRFECPFSGYTIIHNCTNKIGMLSSQCPKYQAQCGNLSSTNHHLCTVVTFSRTETVCNCTVKLKSLSSQRRLDSNSAGDVIVSTSLELVATAAFVAHDFSDTFEAAPNLTTAAEIGNVVIIIVMYSSLWFTAMVILLSSMQIFRVSPQENKPAEITVSDLSVKENLRAYITEAIPVVFNASGRKLRIFAEILRHHKYANLLYSKSVAILTLVRVVTVLSLLMFLLAVFDDLQSPSDDGSCEVFHSATACLARKSPLDSSQSYCKWNIVSDDGSSPGSNDYCSFNDSGSSLQSFLAISVIVSLITAMFLRPVEYLLELLEAPTANEIATKKSLSHRKFNRVIRAGVPMRDMSEDAVKARSTARKSMLTALKDGKKLHGDGGSNSEVNFDDSEAFAVVIQEKAAGANTVIEELKQKILHQRQLLNQNAVKVFDSQWGLEPNLESGSQDLSQHHISLTQMTMDFQPKIYAKIVQDLETVSQLSKRRVQKLKLVGSEQSGLEILHLFMIDLLGRDSPAAKIFESKLGEDFKETKVIRWAWKGVAGVVLLLLNILFPYYTMLYGSVRGLGWQWTFLSTCIAQIFIEIFINETLECLWLNYFVPLLASREVTAAHQVLLGLVDRVGQTGLIDEARYVLNAPDYLFVSKQVAKALPSLMESAIIEKYKSFLPGEGGKLWHQSHLKRAFHRAMAPVTNGSSTLRYVAMIVFFSLTLLEYCATVPYLLQRMAVRFIQPFFVSGIILLFYIVIDSPAFIALFFIFLLALITFLLRRYLYELFFGPVSTVATVTPLVEPEVEIAFIEGESNIEIPKSCDAGLAGSSLLPSSLSPDEEGEIEGSVGSSSLGSSFAVSLPSDLSEDLSNEVSSDDDSSSIDSRDC